MGTFRVNCTIQNIVSSAKSTMVRQLVVDTGSEFTWIPREELERIGVTVKKKDVPFVMANGVTITRDVGYAILKTNGFETVDEVVFAQPGDMKLLGSRTLEGFGAVVDARKKRLVAAGPQLATVAPKEKSDMQKIVPCLWFDSQAEEAVNFYTSLFKNSKIMNVARYDEAGAKASGRPQGSVMTITFQLDGQEFMALNGGPVFKFTEAISFVVNCETQEEVDRLWNNLTEGGEEVQCGWLKDRFGLSWQIVPTALGELMSDPDPAKGQRVMQAMLQMKKIDIAGLRRAYEGR
jgi:predicted 3-demethylubiquinone-9 3-methyltransferase (glyoxalase superfamily)/predicted aspartyl protease